MSDHDLNEPIPAIGYTRVSMAREEMISPEIQRRAIQDWARRTNHRIIDWVEDPDKTGRNFKRKIMRAIERIESGEARVIAVWKFSRFGRTRTGVPANLARVEKVGGQLLSATEEVDARTAIGRFQRGMIMEFNAFESDRAGEQWKETHQLRRDEGLPHKGGRRFGYIWHPRKVYAPDGTITIQQERYEPDPALQDVVRDLYERYVAGTGFGNLAALLNEAGIPNALGSLWSNRTVCLYMDSGFAAGYLRIHDPACKLPYRSNCPAHKLIRHPTKQHPAIISNELWEMYQARRGFTKTAAPHSRKAKYPLSALTRCGLCQAAALRVGGQRAYAAYACTTRHQKGATVCQGVRTPAADVEAGVLKWLARFADEIDADPGSEPAAESRLRGLSSTLEEKRAAAKSEVERLERAVAKHMRVYAMSEEEDPDGTLEREYLATLSDLRAEKAAAAARLTALDEVPGETQVASMKAAAAPVAAGLVAEWDSMPPDRTNALLRRLIDQIELRPGGIVDVVPVWEAYRDSLDAP
ncbi:recombinase family protein [Kitasatospora aureofaciens]|uniref:recombinase family protein n=1 Tax=Kitasatospora aureofaciens TaxID=1894 RepID=UPI0034027FC5